MEMIAGVMEGINEMRVGEQVIGEGQIILIRGMLSRLTWDLSTATHIETITSITVQYTNANTHQINVNHTTIEI